jgi:hypothetical protein
MLSYDPETGIWTWLVARGQCIHPGDVAGGVGKTECYWRITVDGRKYLAHRLAWLWMTGSFSPAEIDHINADKTDNRFANLRPATHGQNRQNIKAFKNNWSGCKGVYLLCSKPGHPAAWRVQIRANGKTHQRTCRGTLGEAEEIRARLSKELHGEFARAE